MLTGPPAGLQKQIPSSHQHPPPADLPQVELRFVNAQIGLGIFAARDIDAGEYFLHEAPALSARFMGADGGDESTADEELSAYRAAARRIGPALLRAYPYFAAATGQADRVLAPTSDPDDDDAPPDFSDLGHCLVPSHGRFAGSTVTAEQYAVVSEPAKEFAGRTLDLAALRQGARQFFKHYAFVAMTGETIAPGRKPLMTTSYAHVRAC